MKALIRCAAVLSATLLTACAYHPTGPSQMALPGSSSTFERFQADDVACQAYAQQASGALSAQEGAQKGAVDSAVVGTIVGAAAGAVIGGAAGDPATGAGIGAGSGLLLGSAAGSDAYAVSGHRMQERYDNAYVQCMYGKGHQVPVPARMAQSYNSAPAANPAPVAPAPAPAAPRTTLPPASYPPPGTPPPPGY